MKPTALPTLTYPSTIPLVSPSTLPVTLPSLSASTPLFDTPLSDQHSSPTRDTNSATDLVPSSAEPQVTNSQAIDHQPETSSNIDPTSTPISASESSSNTEYAPTSSSSSSPSPPPPTNIHHMVTRSKTGNLKPKVFLSQVEPTTVKQALSQPKWLEAMQAEYDALMRNVTWPLVELPANHQAIGCRWVFRVKENPDGTVNKYKAHLVAKGYHQQHGLDFIETFSPVVKPVTIRIILTLALTHGWPL